MRKLRDRESSVVLDSQNGGLKHTIGAQLNVSENSKKTFGSDVVNIDHV